MLEYACTVWDPSDRQTVHNLEMVQNRATRFVANLKGRDSVSNACGKLGLQSLESRRRNQRIALLMKILSHESKHNVLASAYDEITTDRKDTTIITRAAARGEPTSIIYAMTRLFHNSFLPRTVRDLRLKPQTAT